MGGRVQELDDDRSASLWQAGDVLFLCLDRYRWEVVLSAASIGNI